MKGQPRGQDRQAHVASACGVTHLLLVRLLGGVGLTTGRCALVGLQLRHPLPQRRQLRREDLGRLPERYLLVGSEMPRVMPRQCPKGRQGSLHGRGVARRLARAVLRRRVHRLKSEGGAAEAEAEAEAAEEERLLRDSRCGVEVQALRRLLDAVDGGGAGGAKAERSGAGANRA